MEQPREVDPHLGHVLWKDEEVQQQRRQSLEASLIEPANDILESNVHAHPERLLYSIYTS